MRAAATSTFLETTEAPIGEMIGPFVFWPLLVIAVAVLVWALWRRARRAKAARSGHAAAGSTGTRPEDYAAHHRVAWQSDPESFTPTSRDWPLAVAEVFGICTGDPWDRLTLVTLDGPRSGLAEAWGVRSRPQLLSTLYAILREGHRVAFQEQVSDWASLDTATFTRITRSAQAQAKNSAALEEVWRLQQVHADARSIRSVRFEAWDLVRAAMLTRAGHSLGWLSEAEALDTFSLLSAELQRHYAGWEEMGDHFRRARWYWGGASDLESLRQDAHDASRQQALLAAPLGPWSHVPWDMPIPDSRVLLVDAMVAEDLVVREPVSSPTPLAQLIDEVTADRLADRA